MVLSPMRFGDYVWPHNPKIYGIEYKRRIVSHKVPFGLYVLSDMGRDQRILRGEGEFVGVGAYEQFKKLANTFYSSEPKVLVHPIWQSARAWLVDLKLRQEPRENYVAYEFEFWECYEGYESSPRAIKNTPNKEEVPENVVKPEAYALKRGDTLWGLATKNGLTLNQLLTLNPQIRNPNIYYVGDLVYLT